MKFSFSSTNRIKEEEKDCSFHFLRDFEFLFKFEHDYWLQLAFPITRRWRRGSCWNWINDLEVCKRKVLFVTLLKKIIKYLLIFKYQNLNDQHATCCQHVYEFQFDGIFLNFQLGPLINKIVDFTCGVLKQVY